MEGRRPAGSTEAAPGAGAYGPSVLHLQRIACQAHMAPREVEGPRSQPLLQSRHKLLTQKGAPLTSVGTYHSECLTQDKPAMQTSLPGLSAMSGDTHYNLAVKASSRKSARQPADP